MSYQHHNFHTTGVTALKSPQLPHNWH